MYSMLTKFRFRWCRIFPSSSQHLLLFPSSMSQSEKNRPSTSPVLIDVQKILPLLFHIQLQYLSRDTRYRYREVSAYCCELLLLRTTACLLFLNKILMKHSEQLESCFLIKKVERSSSFLLFLVALLIGMRECSYYASLFPTWPR